MKTLQIVLPQSQIKLFRAIQKESGFCDEDLIRISIERLIKSFLKKNSLEEDNS